MYIIFDTETTGLPRDWNAPITDTDNWPRVIQIAWQLHDDMGAMIEHQDFLIRPEGFDIPYDAEQIHGISTELAREQGEPLENVLKLFNEALSKAKFVVGQNIKFDINVTGCEFVRTEVDTPMLEMGILDTCTETTASLCQIPGGRGGKFKLPTLTELHQYLFNAPFAEAHNATADVEATTRCFFELMRRGVFLPDELQQEERYIEDFKAFNPAPIGRYGLKHENLKEASAKYKVDVAPTEISDKDRDEALAALSDYSFAHLHNHTQFSILQSTIQVNDLVAKAAEFNMRAVALTDTGNMMAAFHFERAVSNHNKGIAAKRAEAEENGDSFEEHEIMPIIGCEFNVCRDLHDKSVKDNGYQVVFLAKNKRGYHNLIKLASIAYTEGMYYVPRIDKKAVEKYREDLIVLTGNLYGEVPNLVLNVGETQAEEALVWWKQQFGDDLYVELMRHGQENEDRVNETLVRLANKHEVKLIASNNTYYIEKGDAEAHDVLLCVKDNELVATPKGRGRGFRYGLDNEEYYFKSQEEMKDLFLDVPEAIQSIDEVIAKCEPYGLARDVLLPAFDIPEEFLDAADKDDGGKRGENNYLRYLAYEGAKERYGEITSEIEERLDFELETVTNTGYPGYFLIVWDFLVAAREMGVSVGPGRGSAAGSVVAYCLKITNIDPLEYDLLFERFLNPDRVSMPDIDIDFDDVGRQRVIDWVVDKYGRNQVAQIITFGTMAARSSIRDVGRVMSYPLSETDKLAKLIPTRPGTKLYKILNQSDKELRSDWSSDDFSNIKELHKIRTSKGEDGEVLRLAEKVEGTVRNTGIHAAGLIIAPDDITKYIPVSTSKDSELLITQFDGSIVEDAGMLKMDFLGLKTLSIIKDAIDNIVTRYGEDRRIDPDEIPLDDADTYELFQRGDMIGIFQFESDGMRKFLRELKPTVLEDLIAMNALYRPGPMDNIPAFIKRKHGLEDVTYPHQWLEDILKPTYGIMVYQEQIMQTAQVMADYSLGKADMLRRAMGKKKLKEMEKHRQIFQEGAANKGVETEIANEIFDVMEKFASYGFNRSHAAAYSILAFQTAYLKTHYPAEFMASVLTHNKQDISKLNFFLREAKRMGIKVLGPNINESHLNFTVNDNGFIRFGLSALKGVGEGPVEAIIEGRTETGKFESIWDMTKRLNLRTVNKKCLESLAQSGALDEFNDGNRAQYFARSEQYDTVIEHAVKFGNAFQNQESQMKNSLFGDMTQEILPDPKLPQGQAWNKLELLNKEKEVTGIFISGHPLDDYEMELNHFVDVSLDKMDDIKERSVRLAGLVTEVFEGTTQKGLGYKKFALQDFKGSKQFGLYNEQFKNFGNLVTLGAVLYVEGMNSKGYNSDNYYFRVKEVRLLDTVGKLLTKSITLRVPVDDITDRLIDELNNISNPQGQHKFKILVVDQTNNVELDLVGADRNVTVDTTLLDVITRLGLPYKLN